jgi:pimeloyl-ACP methyl ester carboxylesterase
VENLRKYGKAPFDAAVVHGGPGAPGEMAPVALELASGRGILEPLQTASSLDGQVEELRAILEENGHPPLTLIGFSWGAWLSFILAARYPATARKLIMVGSGAFEEQYATGIMETRLSHLSEEDRAEVKALVRILEGDAAGDRNAAFARFGTLLSGADAYDPIAHESTPIEYQVDIFQSVWSEAAELRRSGQLLELGKRIECPVVAVQGEHDPHQAEGVRTPLSAILKSFRFILLEDCGHRPWIERRARDRFYEILRAELSL